MNIANVVACQSCAASESGSAPSPTIWAWDAAADLRFLTPGKESVAYYVGTILVSDENVYFKPRNKIFKVPPDERIFPVFRIETRGVLRNETRTEAKSSAQIKDIISIIKTNIANQKQNDTPIVQIDFDATLSEREFYKALLKQMRKELDPKTRINVTALASWCLGDKWLSHDYVDEAVVMLFSMGGTEAQILKYIANNELVAGKGIELSIGLSANESRTNATLLKNAQFLKHKHLYLFNSLPWTQKTLLHTENELCHQ